MRKIFALLFILLFIGSSFPQELRGTWIARNTLSSKEAIAQAMDSLAANNFNTVYINAWSRGYPLWQSSLFFNETGMSVDPTYTGRDILAEAVSEAHRVGLHVEAWFEYGFVGGWTGNLPPGGKGPIFDSHPDWVAKKQDGSEIDNSNFYWMIHTHPDVQNFLIGLCTEVARKYDIDGIELDRIRYSSLDYGYDWYTDSLYRMEHNGTQPPANVNDSGWLRWRADNLNAFMQRTYDSIKTVNPHVNISNAPSLYSSNSYTSYNSFAQDWVWWLNNGGVVDNVQVQSYVGSSAAFGSIIDFMSSLINDKSHAYPSFAVSPGGTQVAVQELVKFVNVTRAKGYRGNSIWYFTDLPIIYSYFKDSVYQQKSYPPHSTSDWREYFNITEISNQNDVQKHGQWLSSSIAGYNGASLYAAEGDSNYIDYFIDVPVNGWFEVYAFEVIGSNRTDSAKYIVYDSSSNETAVFADQSTSNNRRWYKLGDYYLNSGRNKILKAVASNVDAGKYLSADAVMISLNRRLSPNVVNSVEQGSKTDKQLMPGFDLQNYPNPFNGQTRVSFNLKSLEPYSVKLYNIIGEEVLKINRNPVSTGLNQIDLNLNSSSIAAGIYLLRLKQAERYESLKIVYAK
ncbi:MAG: family 10 glycosylhydrolase [Ignavibacteriaceae bacterium]|nr:family 10 glycosylhydrolase [Ignavibacteriaceae bacterium]